MKPNILQLCLSPDLGGLELYVKRLASFLADRANLVCVLNEKGRLREAFEGEARPFIGAARPSVFGLYFAAKRLARIIDDHEVDLVHVHWTKDLPLAVLGKSLSERKPKLVQTRHMAMTRFKGDPYHRFLYKNLDLMIAVTRQVQEQLEAFLPKSIRPLVETHYPGAASPEVVDGGRKQEIRQQYGLGSDFVVGMVGRIEEGKGQYLLIDAIGRLKKEGVHSKALIVGPPMELGYLDQLKAMIGQEGLEDDIVFTGFQRNAQALMQVCDVLVLATHNETFGLVLIEAMQCGVAVVGSNCGGPLEIIDDGKTGLLFETRSSLDLATKIKTLALNKAVRERLARQGREKALEAFDEQSQFYRLFDRLLGLRHD